MISLNNVWSDKNSINLTVDTHPSPITVQIESESTQFTPPSQSLNICVANVPFGKSTVFFPCDYSQLSYKREEFESELTNIDNQFTELFGIKWYRGDMVHHQSSKTTFIQGFIANNINHPITLKLDSSFIPTVGFLYGNTIDLPIIMNGNVSDLELETHWWDYIRYLLKQKLFDDITYSNINHHILNKWEKNAIDIKG